ncbi:MAG: thioredoxin family protein [Terriglobales bacterium]
MPVVRSCKNCEKSNRVPVKHLADQGRCGACKAPLPPLDEPLQADAELFDEIVREARVPVLVDFWAAWCGPCQKAAPEVARTAKEMSGHAIVTKIDTERYPQLAARFKVQGIPNFVVLYGGRTVRQQVGVAGHEEMENWLREAATPAA